MQAKNYFYRFYKNEETELSSASPGTDIKQKADTHENFIQYTEKMMETFEKVPFGDVDALVLSWLSYIEFPDICINDEPVRLGDLFKAEYFEQMYSTVVAKEETRVLFTAAAASPRFRDIGVSHYVSRLDSEALKQFSAVNFHVSDNLRFIAFRGTDKYIVGWKEDLCLALSDPVESQKSSVRYLTRCASDFDGEILLGGHSKGGNLSIYAAAQCDDEVQNKITRIYSFDGPGVDDEESKERIEKIYGKVIKIVPQASVIGLLMENHTNYRIVKSEKRGFAQHMAFYWHIVNGFFEYTDNLSFDSRAFGKSMNSWIQSLKYEERAQFVQSIFELLNTSSIETLDDIDLIHTLPEIKKNYDGMDPEARSRLISNMKTIISSSLKNLPASFDNKRS